jgi:PEP-CTERM motif
VCGGAPVKSLRCCLILILLGLSSSAALANSIPDPGLGVRGDPLLTHTLWTGSVVFTINSDTALCDVTCNFTSGPFFINAGTIHNFDFSFDRLQIGIFTALADSAFPTVTTVTPFREAILSGGTIFPACDCSNTTNQIFGDWVFEMTGVVNGSVVTVTSNVPTPEPGTMILLLSGLGAVGLRRLRRNKVPS